MLESESGTDHFTKVGDLDGSFDHFGTKVWLDEIRKSNWENGLGSDLKLYFSGPNFPLDKMEALIFLRNGIFEPVLHQEKTLF